MHKVIYKEKQFYRKTAGFYVSSVLMFLLVIVLCFALFNQVWDDASKSYSGQVDPQFLKTFIVVIVIVLCVFITTFRLKLEVTIDEKNVCYKLSSYSRIHIIEKDQIRSFDVRKGKSIKRFKGLVFRRIFRVRRNTFLIKGDNAICLHLVDGKSILLGTQNPVRFKSALERFKQKEKSRRDG